MALTTLEYVKSQLGIDPLDTSQDDYLTSQIEWLSERVIDYIGKPIEAADYVETCGCLSMMCGCGRRSGPTTIVVPNYPIISVSEVTVGGEPVASDDYYVNKAMGTVCVPSMTYGDQVVINYRAGYETVPLAINQAVSDLTVSRYLGRSGDPSKIVRSESVPDVGSVDYTVSLFYQKGYDPLLGVYGTTFDTYRSERSFGLSLRCAGNDA